MKIFISSPLVGLKQIREYILQNEKSLGVSFYSMESFLSSPNIPKDECLEQLRNSDYVIVLIGPEYGSVDPVSGNSFTEVEYDEATNLKIPIFPFVMASSVGEWEPRDSDEDIKNKHNGFFEKIKRNHTVDTFLNGEELIKKIIPSIEQYKERLTRPYAPFVDYKEYFFAFVGKDKVFRHDYEFVGRQQEMDTIDKFLKSDKKVLTITGRGGIGKSKLIYEIAKKYEGTQDDWNRFLFIKENVVFDNEVLKKIPSGRSVLILEDAHRYDYLLNVLALFRNSDLFSRVKLIITLRPRGSDIVRMNLNISIDSAFIEEMPELQDLPGKEVEQLVQLFITGNPSLVNFIAAVTKDCTLATVIGSKLIADGKITEPAKIKNSEEFNRIVLDRFLDEFKAVLSEDNKVDELLRYLAALSPVNPTDKQFISNLSKALKLKESETIRKIEELEAKGLLVRRGRLVRIAPDLLSDHILYRACISSYGVSTNFANEVYSEFSKDYIANLLTNVAELEWRVKADNKKIDLLQSIWDDIYDRFINATNYERLSILSQVEKAAIFQPAQALKLVEIAIKNSSAKKPKGEYASIYGRWTHKDILRRLPDILKKISYHFNYLRKCCEFLWELGKDDERELNPYPEHPIRVLQDIVGYNNPRQPIAFKEDLIGFLEHLSNQPNIHEHKHSIFEIIKELLGKEGEYTTTNAATFTFHPYVLNIRALMPIRQRAIGILEKCFLAKDNPSIVIRAFRCLHGALGYAHGSFGRVISQEEEDQWLPEQLGILDIIKKGLELNSDMPLKVIIKKDLRWFEKNAHHDEVKDSASSILLSIKEDYDFKIYKALDGDFFDFWDLDIGHKKQEEMINKELESLTDEVISAEEKSSSRIFNKINKALGELNAYLCDPRPENFISKIVYKSPDIGIYCYENILTTSNNIAPYSSALLWGIGKYPEYRDKFDGLIKKGIATKNETIISNIVHAYAWGGLLDSLDEQNFQNIKNIILLNIKNLTPTLVRAIGKLGEKYSTKAKELFLMLILDRDTAEEISSIIDNRYGIAFSSFTKEELETILERLIPIHIFDKQHYHIDQLLKQIAQDFPDLIISFLIKRLVYSRTDKVGVREYAPLPYTGFHTNLFDHNKLKEPKKYIRQIRDLSCTLKEMDTFWLPKLFETVSNNYSLESMEVLSEWIDSRDNEKLIGISLLLREANQGLLFAQYEFIGRLIYEASQISEDCLKHVESNLFGLAVSGTSSRSHGQPAAKDVQLKDEGQQIAEKFPTTHPAHKFYIDVSNYGKERIKEELARDQELEYE